MGDIRLNKIIRMFNIGLTDLVNFLGAQGVVVDANPNDKIPDSWVPIIQDQFRMKDNPIPLLNEEDPNNRKDSAPIMRTSLTDKENRLIGVVRFYDSNKGFGFIETNGLGIDDACSCNTSNSVELFFSYRDLSSNVQIKDGNWVSFLYKKEVGKKRDHALRVKPLLYTRDENVLVQRYLGAYAKIFYSDDVRLDVLLDFVTHVIHRAENGRQFAFDMLMEAFSNDKSDIINRLIYMDYVLDIIVHPEDNNIIVKEDEIYHSFLTQLSIGLFDRCLEFFRSSPSGNKSLFLFISCLGSLKEEGLSFLCKYIVQAIESISDYQLFYNPILHFLETQLPIHSFSLLFENYQGEMPPSLRILVFKRLGKESVLLHDSILEYFNWILSPGSASILYSLFGGRSHPRYSDEFPVKLEEFISLSPSANDYLLLYTFVMTSNSSVFERIKDKSICYTWLPNQDNEFIQKFMRIAQYVSDDILVKTVDTIGVTRLADIARLNGSDYINNLPSSKVINIFAKINTVDETEFSNIVSYGGYWTWGEGMKNERYKTEHYLIKKYGYKVFVDSLYYDYLFNNIPNLLKATISERIQYCLREKLTWDVFPSSICGKDFLFNLTISESVGDDYRPLYYESEQSVKIYVGTDYDD